MSSKDSGWLLLACKRNSSSLSCLRSRGLSTQVLGARCGVCVSTERMPKKKKTRFAPDGTPLDKKPRKADDRDKAKKAKAAEDKAAGIKPTEPVKRVGKGHRQKGAGSVMTAREEREVGKSIVISKLIYISI